MSRLTSSKADEIWRLEKEITLLKMNIRSINSDMNLLKTNWRLPMKINKCKNCKNFLTAGDRYKCNVYKEFIENISECIMDDDE